MNLKIAELDEVRLYTSLPWFSALLVTEGPFILFERYADDYRWQSPHSLQSISKTLANLVVGRLVDEGVLDLSTRIRHYLPEIASGYADATLQRVLNMDVVNDYSEDFTDGRSTYYRHEEAMGWRLSTRGAEVGEEKFIGEILSSDVRNTTGHVQYKDANTTVLACVIERASGQPLRHFLAEVVDAAGLEGALHITTDREGLPCLAGGVCLTARDLARYLSIFARWGCGTEGQIVGSRRFIEDTLSGGVPMLAPFEGIRYSNHTMVEGPYLGHGGWGGQYALINLETGRVGVFLSVLENEHATNHQYLGPVVRMLERITA